MIYTFETFELDEQSFCLTQEGQRVPLEPKSLRVLLLLVQSEGRLLEKDAILDAVWKGTFVEETTLTRAVALVRKQLGDDPRRPKFIETVPTLGYRFIAPVAVRARVERAAPVEAPVEAAAAAAPEAAPVVETAPVAVIPDAGTAVAKAEPAKRWSAVAITAAVTLLLALAGGIWLYRSWSGKHWAREEAIPQVTELVAARRPLAAFAVLERARKYAPADPQIQQAVAENTLAGTITSSPAGATVAMQDYLTPDAPWRTLGETPLKDVLLPKGYLRWKIAKAGVGEMVVAGRTRADLNFALDAFVSAPPGMVPVPAGEWTQFVDFLGWLGPYPLPAYYADRTEVTNRDFQKFVDSGGYEKKEYWTEKFTDGGRDLPFDEAMTRFRDTTGRSGPSTWVGGHSPEGQADFPVSGVSWFEASAYAAFAGKSLPQVSQWYKLAPSNDALSIVPASNISTSALAPTGAYRGLGPYGTYDTAGNVREWVANPDDAGHRFILGGSWRSLGYMYEDPETLSPFDRSDVNGFRCVRNLGPLPEEATKPVLHSMRDFAKFKPASDDVFRAYKALYDYPNTPLHQTVDGTVQETADWREEKVSFDTGYRGERMSAYLFLPKKVKPPFQTVLFFPSAAIMFIPDNKGGRNLGDVKFFDYIVQSGRAVMYPIYQDTYERRVKFSLPGGAENIQLTTDWYKDAGRSLDYLATRPDIDTTKLAYLGDSMGSAEGVIATALLQDRLRTAIFLDGGFFLDAPPPGGDAADFAPRMKKPVLMVNGRYDYVFSVEKAQNPLFKMLGAPEQDKRHVILESPHDVSEQRPQMVRAVLDWLDRYLGRVSE